MKKPYDIGNTLICGSVSSNGKLISVNIPNKEHGYLKLTSIPAFPDGKWYDAEFVRNYRNSFLSEKTAENGYGLEFFTVESDIAENINSTEDFHYTSGSSLFKESEKNGLELEEKIIIPPNLSAVLQQYTLYNKTDRTKNINCVMSGRYGIIRASYAQITENGPIPMPHTLNSYTKINNNTFKIFDTGTSLFAAVSIVGDGMPNMILPENIAQSSCALKINVSEKIELTPGESLSIGVVTILTDDELSINNQITYFQDSSFARITIDTCAYWDKMHVECSDKVWQKIINRNIAYVVGCCCFKNYGAMITDNQSLPLTWNRDNYFMYKLLETAYFLTKNHNIFNVMHGHVKWLFDNLIDDCWWGRSHLITGKVKDRVFQFDQQCYPILELFDLYQIADIECRNSLEKYFNLLDGIVDKLFEKKGAGVMLFETDENPADDPVLYPYHFSTQILAWKMFDVMHELNIKHSFSNRNYQEMSEQVKKDVFKFMTAEYKGKNIFCYTTDLKNGFEFYHDANDLPFALASLWNFVEADNDIYKNTIDFAFSCENKGYYGGVFGGLGSEHAKGHWPLGDSQLLAVSLGLIPKDSDDGDKIWKETIEMLQSIVMRDGLFSESVYPNTGQVYTRYWFAWPGATISWLYLLKEQLNKKSYNIKI